MQAPSGRQVRHEAKKIIFMTGISPVKLRIDSKTYGAI